MDLVNLWVKCNSPSKEMKPIIMRRRNIKIKIKIPKNKFLNLLDNNNKIIIRNMKWKLRKWIYIMMQIQMNNTNRRVLM